jgi:hypothetical protein
MDQLYSDATNPENDRRVQAAKQYWDMAKAIAPPEPERGPSRQARDLSDDELRKLLSAAALVELEGRLAKTPVAEDASTELGASAK